MHTIQSSLYALILGACLLCFVIIKGSNGKRPVYFMGFVIVEALIFVFEWLMVHPTFPGKSLWLGLLMASSLLVAPCLWLFASEVTEGTTPSWRSLPAWQLMMIALGVLLVLPLILRAHWGPDFADPRDTPTAPEQLILHGTMLAAATLFLLQVPYYAGKCVHLIRRQVDCARILFSDLEPARLNTLRILLLVVCAQWAVGLMRVLHCMFLGNDTGLGVYFAGMQVGLTLWAFVTVMRRSAVISVEDRALAVGVHLLDAGKSIADDDESIEERRQYAKSALDASTRQRIVRKLTEALDNKQCYRDNQLSLRNLCQLMNENPHYVSQVINQDFNTTFYELVNRSRIEWAKAALLRSPDAAIIDIAVEAGFNSKSTFNSAFRKHLRMTPSEYRQIHQQAPRPT